MNLMTHLQELYVFNILRYLGTGTLPGAINNETLEKKISVFLI